MMVSGINYQLCHVIKSYSTFQLAEFTNFFCPDVVEASIEDDAEDFSQKCREWLEIAFNICIDRLSEEINVTKQVWNWMLNLVMFRASNGLSNGNETFHSYDSFKVSPNNLSMADCTNLFRKVCSSFLAPDSTDVMEFRQQSSQASKSGDNTMWITDFLLYLNLILIFAFIVALWLVKSDIQEFQFSFQSESEYKSTQVEHRSINVDNNLIELPALLPTVFLEQPGETSTDEMLEKTAKVGSEPKTEPSCKLKSKSPDLSPESSSEIFICGTLIGSSIETPPSTIESPLITSTPEISRATVNKVAKNFVEINKKKLTTRCRSSLTGLEKSKISSKSSIPVWISSVRVSSVPSNNK